MQNSPTKHDATSLRRMKGEKPIAMLTAYTTPIARCLQRAGVQVILVGDSVGMVDMGFDSTRHVTIEHMQYHVGAVRRGAPDVHIIGDLPYLTDKDGATAVHNARMLLDAGADSVKLEGPRVEVIRQLVEHGIDVVGHTGLAPQTADSFKQVGRTEQDAHRVQGDAAAIVAAGAFLLVIEHVPSQLASRITATVPVPTIGIGAGSSCDGQVLVINDVIGLGDNWPPFSRQYARAGELVTAAARRYVDEVEGHTF